MFAHLKIKKDCLLIKLLYIVLVETFKIQISNAMLYTRLKLYTFKIQIFNKIAAFNV